MSKITEFPKNTREQVVFSLSQFKGRSYLDMRLYLVGENGGPDIPTRKGLTLNVDLFPYLKEGLGQVEAALIQSGLLDPEDLQVQT